MASNKLPIFQVNPSPAGISFANADGTTVKTIYTAGVEGALIDNIAVVSDDTSAVILVLTYNDGTTDFPIGEVSIPVGSGTDGSSPAVNLLSATAMPFLQAGGGLPLGNAHSLKINAKSAVTAAKTVTLVAFGGNY